MRAMLHLLLFMCTTSQVEKVHDTIYWLSSIVKKFSDSPRYLMQEKDPSHSFAKCALLRRASTAFLTGAMFCLSFLAFSGAHHKLKKVMMEKGNSLVCSLFSITIKFDWLGAYLTTSQIPLLSNASK